MPSIDIDFEVYKAVTARRPSEEVSENDVLRQLFGLPPKQPATVAGNGTASGGWVTKGVHFPDGTELRAKYRGQTYGARVEGGVLVLNGKSFDSVSNAARSITQNNVDGWRFWECRFPGQQSWRTIKSLRK